MLQVSYETAELKAICLKLEMADQQLGRIYATDLMTLLADAEACETAQGWHDILGDDVQITASDAFTVRLGARYTLEFVSVDGHRKFGPDGYAQWKTVEFIKLVRIMDQS